MEYSPLYSGPNRSGICKCGHSWEDHHLGIVMRQSYIDETHEGYIPQECEFYGVNEDGGMEILKNGDRINHCHRYQDRGIEE